MFGIEHLPELIVVLLLALIFVGPGKLPDMGAALGKGIAEFRKATREVRGEAEESSEIAPPSAQHRRGV